MGVSLGLSAQIFLVDLAVFSRVPPEFLMALLGGSKLFNFLLVPFAPFVPVLQVAIVSLSQLVVCLPRALPETGVPVALLRLGFRVLLELFTLLLQRVELLLKSLPLLLRSLLFLIIIFILLLDLLVLVLQLLEGVPVNIFASLAGPRDLYNRRRNLVT